MVAVLLALSGPAAARNLLDNSSFEIGPDHRFAVGRWYMNGLPNASLDKAEKVHGTASLKLPFSRRGYTRDEKFGMELRGAVPVLVEQGETYTFSIYLKTDVPDADAALEISPRPPYEHRGKAVASKKIKMGRKFTPDGFEYPWKRHSITFVARKTEKVFWVARIDGKRRGTLWADAVQFEAGELTAYRPRLDTEVGLFDSVIGHIHDVGQPPEMDFVVYNDTDAAVERQARLRILDERGAVLSERILTAIAPGRSRKIEKIKLDVAGRNGFFVAELVLPDVVGGYRQDTVFSILRRPRPIVPAQSAFGAYITPSEEALRIMSRAGFRWTATLTSAEVLANWGDVEKRKGRYDWHDSELDLFRRYGFEVMMNLEGWAYPKWAEKLDRQGRADAFARYVEAATRRYRGKIRYFNFADEIHNKIPGSHMLGRRSATWKDAREYAAWHKVAHAAAKRGNPGSIVVLNTEPGPFSPDNLFRYLSPDTVDVLAANYYPYPDAIGKLKRSATKAGVATLWAPGVAMNTWPTYFRDERPMNDGSGDYLERVVRTLIRTFSNGADVFFHYTGSYVGNTNVYSVMEHDSSLETGGAQFAALAWLVDGFTSVRPVSIIRSNRVEAYRFDRRDGNTVFAVWSNLKGADQQLAFKAPVRGAQLFDRWTTETIVDDQKGLTDLELGWESRFLMVPTADADALERALSRARYRVSSLPAAEEVRHAGRYALVRQYQKRGREKRLLPSLWYRSDHDGWIEILRLAFDSRAQMTVDDAGGTVRFLYDWDGRPHHLFLGSLAPALWGARFWRSIEKDGKVSWQSGAMSGGDTPRKAVEGHRSRPLPMKSPPRSPAYVIELEDGSWLTISTSGEQPNLRFPVPGAWNLFASKSSASNKYVKLRRYAHGGEPHRRDISVRFAVARDRGT